MNKFNGNLKLDLRIYICMYVYYRLSQRTQDKNCMFKIVMVYNLNFGGYVLYRNVDFEITVF